MPKKVMLSAAQPSRSLTLGNYLGAIRNWVRMQKEYDCLFFGVDLHTITVRQDPKLLLDQTYRIIASYIAAGLDPDECTLFLQSHVHQHAELAWVLNCYSYMGELNRMTQFKDKSSREGQNIGVGLFTYPSLMAADILLYQTDLVPVGEDQKQHLEFTRDLAIRLNNLYGKDLFIVPDAYIPPVGARILSLQDPTSKMSKSDPDPGATVFLDDTDDLIVKKLKRAVTDSGTEITDDPLKPGIANLLTIQSAITGQSKTQLVESYRGKQYGHLKLETADLLVETIRPIREKTKDLMDNRDYLDRIFQSGADRARTRASVTLNKVYERIGFILPSQRV